MRKRKEKEKRRRMRRNRNGKIMGKGKSKRRRSSRETLLRVKRPAPRERAVGVPTNDEGGTGGVLIFPRKRQVEVRFVSTRKRTKFSEKLFPRKVKQVLFFFSKVLGGLYFCGVAKGSDPSGEVVCDRAVAAICEHSCG